MKFLLIAAGLLVLLVVLVDIFKTILYVHGGGRLSTWISRSVWKFYFLLGRKNARNPILNLAGGSILMLLVFSWSMLIWLGYSLIYISEPGSVVDTATGQQTDIIGKIYYVGYTLTSLGNGDLKSGSDTWRLVSNIMGMNSMVFISLGISYLLPVLQAVIDKRSLAAHIQKMGRTPQEIIENGYNGENFAPLYDRFSNLETSIIKHGERHLAYPILHFFHSSDRSHALHISLAVLDEAISIQETYKLDTSEKAYSWEILRKAVDHLKDRLTTGFMPADCDPPGFEYYESLPEAFRKNLKPNDSHLDADLRNERRARLLEFVTRDGWEWEDVVKVRE
ncbi:hypothetical protein ACW6QP_06875 [Salegentibacter sp. HM20]